MVKKIGILTGIFALGVFIAVLAESKLRHLIQSLFQILTHDAIHFYGKDFHLFASPYYYLCFGVLLVMNWVSWEGMTLKQIVLAVLFVTMIFLIGIVITCWLYSNLVLIECTACDDGTRGIHYNHINYDAVIVGNLILLMIPAGVRLVRKVAVT